MRLNRLHALAPRQNPEQRPDRFRRRAWVEAAAGEVMTKKMNRLASQQWAEEQDRKDREEADAKRLAGDLEALRKIRDHLLHNWRGEPTQALVDAVDDYAGFLTGNREALWAQDARSIQPDNRGTRARQQD